MLNVEAAIQELAESVLAQLLHPPELGTRLGLLIEVSDHDEDDFDRELPDVDWFAVALSDHSFSRVVSVSIDSSSGAAVARSTASAAYELARAFQDEVIELVGAGRPACAGHAHPMGPRLSDVEAWWACPADSSRRQPIWPA